jgi:hypothetical protein
MTISNQQPSTALAPLVMAWLALVALTFLSLMLGQWFRGAVWLQLLVAAIVWIKGSLVAWKFIESELAYPFIRNVLRGFIFITTMALVLTAVYGLQFAR